MQRHRREPRDVQVAKQRPQRQHQIASSADAALRAFPREEHAHIPRGQPPQRQLPRSHLPRQEQSRGPQIRIDRLRRQTPLPAQITLVLLQQPLDRTPHRDRWRDHPDLPQVLKRQAVAPRRDQPHMAERPTRGQERLQPVLGHLFQRYAVLLDPAAEVPELPKPVPRRPARITTHNKPTPEPHRVRRQRPRRHNPTGDRFRLLHHDHHHATAIGTNQQLSEVPRHPDHPLCSENFAQNGLNF